MEQKELLEYHQKRIELISDIIQGYVSTVKLHELELKIINTKRAYEIDFLLDGIEKVKKTMDAYSRAYRYSELYLENAGVEIDYSFLNMNREQWKKTVEWEKKWIHPYTRKKNPLIQFIKSFLLRIKR